jgi:hypothetical protein
MNTFSLYLLIINIFKNNSILKHKLQLGIKNLNSYFLYCHKILFSYDQSIMNYFSISNVRKSYLFID